MTILTSYGIFKYTFFAWMSRTTNILEFIFKSIKGCCRHNLKAINDYFVIRLKIFDFIQNLRWYLTQYLYSKLICKSGRTARVWSNYSAVLPQSSSEREAMRAVPGPMAWVWSYYRSYLGCIGNNKYIDADTQSLRSTIIHK